MRRGRLLDAAATPTTGERISALAEVGNVLIEQILSAQSSEPLDFDQPHDEWVVVLAGAATIEVGGEAIALEAGDWVLLPGGTPHRVVQTAAGTNWLAVHIRS